MATVKTPARATPKAKKSFLSRHSKTIKPDSPSRTEKHTAESLDRDASETAKPAQSFLDLSNVYSYTEEDLDALLSQATSALEQRAAISVADEAVNDTVEVNSKLASTTFAGKDSLLVQVKLDAHLPSSHNPYFVEKSSTGPVRLNPSKIEIATKTTEMIVPHAKGNAAGLVNSHSKNSQDVAKGLGRGASKGLLDRIVVARVQNEIAPELDHDAKTKKKLIKETAGPKWFDLPAPDLTDNLKREIQIIKARNVLDPKHHYRRADKNAPEFPKFFQMGTVIEGAGEFHKKGRINKRDRRDGLVEEVLADDKTKTYLKRKFGEIQVMKQTLARKPTKKLRRKGSGGGGKRG
ncbi:hypothetical protein CcCBS67573_g00924 [Chytriomyces confervae]|uniref:Fcf2 pre-rRNA processing C-terminal domain-containing protein n=1 Tax=Chytriomyces confervae TaxID=246404 RepID=A0A507FSC0_9FUNG|nr:hypothetical protein HDU80_003602 [Chytriomyces hyalinus]TPX77797.1 hypothetical protein CcCBS67573_g00924 [Chytriomyces confervae]